ncbi:MAG TPA: S8 family serine peptidase, partial [Pyrinomonadaceae bacterium]|nr:S8 family serine peptidase [Pyrinomonadaceae bacterium]
MLRRITACLNASALVLVSLLPLTVASGKAHAATAQVVSTTKIAPELLQSGTPGGDGTTTSTNTGGGSEAEGTGVEPLVRVVVQTKGRPSAAQQDAIASSQGQISQSYETLNTIIAEVPVGSLSSLAAREDVAYISSDRVFKSQMSLARDTVGATEIAAGLSRTPKLTGKGVTIAIMDSGISTTHADFAKNKNKSRILTAVNFTGSGTGDDNGHGTGVASVAAGSGVASPSATTHAGIAPDANLVDLRVLDANGAGKTSDILRAVNWAILNRERYNIRVLNMSIGAPVRESFRHDPVCRAVADAVRAGIIVVASAGNSGRTEETNANGPFHRLVYGTVKSPGNSPYVITVGATDS